MGYGYLKGALTCDNCGTADGARRRTCPHTVLTDSLRGPRQQLRYCKPSALCRPCYDTIGGREKLHAACKDAAVAAQAEYDAIEALLDSGEALSVAAWGSWQDTVPDGQVGVAFHTRTGKTVWRLVPADEYDQRTGTHVRLSQITNHDWPGHPGTDTKGVA